MSSSSCAKMAAVGEVPLTPAQWRAATKAVVWTKLCEADSNVAPFVDAFSASHSQSALDDILQLPCIQDAAQEGMSVVVTLLRSIAEIAELVAPGLAADPEEVQATMSILLCKKVVSLAIWQMGADWWAGHHGIGAAALGAVLDVEVWGNDWEDAEGALMDAVAEGCPIPQALVEQAVQVASTAALAARNCNVRPV